MTLPTGWRWEMRRWYNEMLLDNQSRIRGEVWRGLDDDVVARADEVKLGRFMSQEVAKEAVERHFIAEIGAPNERDILSSRLDHAMRAAFSEEVYTSECNPHIVAYIAHELHAAGYRLIPGRTL